MNNQKFFDEFEKDLIWQLKPIFGCIKAKRLTDNECLNLVIAIPQVMETPEDGSPTPMTETTFEEISYSKFWRASATTRFLNIDFVHYAHIKNKTVYYNIANEDMCIVETWVKKDGIEV